MNSIQIANVSLVSMSVLFFVCEISRYANTTAVLLTK